VCSWLKISAFDPLHVAFHHRLYGQQKLETENGFKKELKFMEKKRATRPVLDAEAEITKIESASRNIDSLLGISAVSPNLEPCDALQFNLISKAGGKTWKSGRNTH
jgi:hypothetical protein